MEQSIIEVQQTDMLSAINRSEVDIQIATAKAYPRDIAKALDRIKTIATLDTETAEDCFYALRRGQGNGSQVIEGISVRLAEIIAGAWGNLRVATRIIGNDGKTITAQAVCHDLETNLCVALEVKRRITDRKGNTYSEDMQVVTGNAASAIAFRNAVLKVVPKAVTKRIVNDIKQVALGKAMDVETRRQRMLATYAKLGVQQSDILAYLGAKSLQEVTAEMIFELAGLYNAIKEGTTTVQETFRHRATDSDKIAAETRRKADEARKKTEQAMQQAAEQPTQPSTEQQPSDATTAVDTATGEVLDVVEEA